MPKDDALQKYTEYAAKVEEILKPLSSTFGIDHFFYTSLDPNQDKAVFMSNQSVTIEKLVQIGRFSKQRNEFLSEVVSTHYHKFIWPRDSSDEVGMMLKDTGIKSGISFIRRSGDLIQDIGFASTGYSDDLLNIFVNQNDLLHHFIKYFENEARDILQEITQFSVNFKSSLELSDIKNNERKMKECINSMNIKKLYIPGNNDEIPLYLTRREYETLFLLCQGKSSKQIAHILKISPRTVEGYLNSCKFKFDVNNKFKLIDMALQMEINKLLIISEN